MNKAKIVAFFLVGFLNVYICPWILAQNPPLSLGQVSSVTTLTSCPSQSVIQFASGMDSCYTATITNCPNAVEIPLVFAYKAGTAPINGTIVLLSGSGGSSPVDGNLFIAGTSYYQHSYPANGYNVVEFAWGQLNQDETSFTPMAWEDASNNCGTNCAPNTPPHNIQAAACRPATFLKYINDSSTFHSTGGMCAQGFSAGAGALGYALAWYGAGAWYGVGDSRNGYLDKVELLSGPVFSDIEKGCKVPAVTSPVVCSGDPSFCNPNNYKETNWASAPIQYSGPNVQAMQILTGDSTCDGSTTTSPTSNTKWLDMSIVVGNASFSYPKTVVTGFACGGLEIDSTDAMNNSSTEAWLFFNNSLTTYQGSNYLYEVLDCPAAEGVYGDDDTQVPALTGTPNGFTAILDDMSNSLKTGTMVCQYNHGT